MSYSASLMLALDWERKREVCDDDSPVSPSARIRNASQRLDTLEQQIRRSVHDRLDRLDRAVTASAGVISALNPLAVLSRGYSVTSSERGIITDAAQLSPGDDIRIRLGRGEVAAKVTAVSEE